MLPISTVATIGHMTEPSHTVWEDEEAAREAALAEAGLDLEPEATGSDETDPSGSDEPA